MKKQYKIITFIILLTVFSLAGYQIILVVRHFCGESTLSPIAERKIREAKLIYLRDAMLEDNTTDLYTVFSMRGNSSLFMSPVRISGNHHEDEKFENICDYEVIYDGTKTFLAEKKSEITKKYRLLAELIKGKSIKEDHLP